MPWGDRHGMTFSHRNVQWIWKGYSIKTIIEKKEKKKKLAELNRHYKWALKYEWKHLQSNPWPKIENQNTKQDRNKKQWSFSESFGKSEFEILWNLPSVELHACQQYNLMNTQRLLNNFLFMPQKILMWLHWSQQSHTHGSDLKVKAQPYNGMNLIHLNINKGHKHSCHLAYIMSKGALCTRPIAVLLMHYGAALL